VHCFCASVCGFDSLHGKVRAKETRVITVIVKMMGRENGRDDGDIGVELHPHEAVDHRFRNEIMPVDSSIDDEAGSHDCGVMATAREPLRMERDLECPWHPEQVDLALINAERGDLLKKRIPASVDDLRVPLGLYECEPDRLAGFPIWCDHASSLCHVSGMVAIRRHRCDSAAADVRLPGQPGAAIGARSSSRAAEVWHEPLPAVG
jgi:hypothetical protein